jgi:hypothetical protein
MDDEVAMNIEAVFADGTVARTGMQLGEDKLTEGHLRNLHAECLPLFPLPIEVIRIPEGVITFEDGVQFFSFRNLRGVDLPSTLKSLAYGTFEFCSHLTTVNMPAGVREIPEYCFEGCSRLQNITLPHGLTEIGIRAFKGAGLGHIDIPATVLNIAGGAFFRCSHLKTVSFAKAGVCELTSIEIEAFEDTLLRRVRIPPSVTHIGPYAFYATSGPLEVVYFEGRSRDQLAPLFENTPEETVFEETVFYPWEARPRRDPDALRARFGVDSVAQLTADMAMQLTHARFAPSVRLVLCSNRSAFFDDEVKRIQFPNVEYSRYGVPVPGGFETLGRLLLRMGLLNAGERLGAQTLRDESFRDMVNLFVRGGVRDALPAEIGELILDQRPSALWFDI